MTQPPRQAVEVAQEDLGQDATHEGNAANIQPDPAKRETFRVRHRTDVEGQVDVLHQANPQAKGTTNRDISLTSIL
ncbi:MAG TPA: hypothetical protein VNH84_04135 [Candidatus Saccharimonadales bacterium]|nr:hypothetical protein [Candidatus Saccharimonadales bacterium]